MIANSKFKDFEWLSILLRKVISDFRIMAVMFGSEILSLKFCKVTLNDIKRAVSVDAALFFPWIYPPGLFKKSSFTAKYAEVIAKDSKSKYYNSVLCELCVKPLRTLRLMDFDLFNSPFRNCILAPNGRWGSSLQPYLPCNSPHSHYTICYEFLETTPSISAPFSITDRSTPAANFLSFHFFFTDLASISITLFEGLTRALVATSPVSSSTA